MAATGARPTSTSSSILSISDRMDDDNVPPGAMAQRWSSGSSVTFPLPRPGSRTSTTTNPKTTTLSTIAMESRVPGSLLTCRLVIALLQTPHLGLHLKVVEMTPTLVKLPDNLAEAEEFLAVHSQVMKNLQSKQSPVEELLRQADNLISTQKPRAEVYMAMADSLGQTWKDLHNLLDERRCIIQIALTVHKNIATCLDKINRVHSDLSRIGSAEDEGQTCEKVSEAVRLVRASRADVLKLLGTCLESGDELLGKLDSLNGSVDSRELYLQRDVDTGKKQVARWLERLHDRRVIFEDKFKSRCEQLDELKDYLVDKSDLTQVEDMLRHLLEDHHTFSFGDDVVSCDTRRGRFQSLISDLKSLQDKVLPLARRLETDANWQGKFYRKAALRTRMFNALVRIQDILTAEDDTLMALDGARDVFVMAGQALDRLTGLSDTQSKGELEKITQGALSKGRSFLDAYGWTETRTRGVRITYDRLEQRTSLLQKELEHLEVLEELNGFLETLNQVYQNVLNLESTLLGHPITIPVDRPAIVDFIAGQQSTLADLSRQLNFAPLLSRMNVMIPSLNENDKAATEEKVNALKKTSSVLVDAVGRRVALASEWLRIVDMFHDETQFPVTSVASLRSLLEKMLSSYSRVEDQLAEVRHIDPHLNTGPLESRMEEMMTELQRTLDEFRTSERVAQVCQTYKARLEEHLVGTTTPGVGGTHFPLLCDADLSDDDPSTGLWPASALSLVRHRVQNKRQRLIDFFTHFLQDYRRDVSALRKESSTDHEEDDFECTCLRVQDKLVSITTHVLEYLKDLEDVSADIERHFALPRSLSTAPEHIETTLNQLKGHYTELSDRINEHLYPKLDQLTDLVLREEPPGAGDQEVRLLRIMTARVTKEKLQNEFLNTQEALSQQLSDKVVQADLDLIERQLNELIGELDTPCPFGDCLADAQTHLANFERFETTVDLLRDKLQRLIAKTIQEHAQKAYSLEKRLEDLQEKRVKRRQLILLSLDYFRLIQISKEHYVRVNASLESIRDQSTSPHITKRLIEDLLKQLEKVKLEESEQEDRLREIERIAHILFGAFDSETFAGKAQHEPLKRENHQTTQEIGNVESSLTELLNQLDRLAGVISQGEAERMGNLCSGKVPQETETALDSASTVTDSGTATLPGPDAGAALVAAKEEKPKDGQTDKSSSLKISVPIPDDQVVGEVVTRHEHIAEETITKTTATIARVASPLPPSISPTPIHRVEKQTQIEPSLKEPTPENQDRDTFTQAMEDKLASTETQTEVKQVVTTATATEVEAPPLEMALPLTAYDAPTFIEPLKDVIVNEGEGVVLECRTTGRVKKLSWLKDGLDISNNPDYKTDFVNGKAVLRIDEVFQEDSAIFTCRATGNEEGVLVETSGKLTVREPSTSSLQPPRFLSHPPLSVGSEGQEHLVQVRIEGNPLPTVQWFKEGVCIDTSPDYIITFNNGLCEVHWDKLIPGVDDGTYVCVGVNRVGQSETRVDLRVEPVKAPSITRQVCTSLPKIVRQLPTKLILRPGQKLNLDCQFQSDGETNVVWIKDDLKILTKNNCSAEIRVGDGVTTLTYNEAYPLNSGKYTVHVRNPAGEVHSQCEVQVKGLLTVETSDSEITASDMEVSKPFIKMELKNTRGKLGESLRLNCVIVGHPEPEVIWYKNGTPLKESPNHHLLFQGDKCSLIVQRMDKTDVGLYAVSAVNCVGEARSSCQVILDEDELQIPLPRCDPPKFTKLLQDQMVTSGSTVEMTCSITRCQDGDPEPDVTWWRNNKRLETTNEIEIFQTGDGYSLRIHNVTPDHKGNYMVKASNSGGDSKCFSCLIVKENLEERQMKPEDVVAVPPRKLSLTKVARAPRFIRSLEGRMVDEGETNIALICVIEANPLANIKWFKNNDELDVSSDGAVFKFNERTGETELVLKKVTTAHGGRYTVSATNEHGEASSMADVVVRKTMFPPVMSKRLQAHCVEKGKRIYLEVDVFAKPSPEICWSLNGNRLDSQMDSNLEMKSDSSTRFSLVVKVASEKYQGEYQVSAKNEAGEAISSCTVTVLTPGDIQSSTASFLPAGSGLQTMTTPAPFSSSTFSFVSQESCKPTSEMTIPGTREESLRERKEVTMSSKTLMTREETHVVRVNSPSFEPLRVPVQPASTSVITDAKGMVLQPGPQPEICGIPGISSSGPWTKKNQVFQKVKSLEEVLGRDSPVDAPAGGVRLIPIAPSPTTVPGAPFKTPPTEAVHQTIETFKGATSSFDQYGSDFISSRRPFQSPPPAPPEASTFTASPFATSSSIHYQTHTVDKPGPIQIPSSPLFSGDSSYRKPSKFVPEKLHESDYESDLESSAIPPKWIPPSSKTSAFVPVTTTSAFAPIRPLTPTMVHQMKPTIAPKPVVVPQLPAPASPAQPSPKLPAAIKPLGVRGLVKTWPPQESPYSSSTMETTSTKYEQRSEMTTTTTLSPHSFDRPGMLSPTFLQPPERQSRSPTPNKEALEMDKLWSKPIRFSSPVPISTPLVHKQVKPEVTSTPKSSPSIKLVSAEPRHQTQPVSTPLIPVATPPAPLSVTTSAPPTWKPTVPLKPSVIKPVAFAPGPSKPPNTEVVSAFAPTTVPPPAFSPPSLPGPCYYVSVVSPPRTTTPVPHGIRSPTPAEMAGSDLPSFRERRDFFEQTATSYCTDESTFHRQETRQRTADSVFHHSRSVYVTKGHQSMDDTRLPPPEAPPVFLYAPPPPGGSRSSSQTMESTSLLDTNAVMPVVTTYATLPRRKPTKFIPAERKSEWIERERRDRGTTEETREDALKRFRHVHFAPAPELRNSLTTAVDKEMKGLNDRFKSNIGQMSQGLAYNATDRKISNDMGPESAGGTVSDANPLIYFKYDFGYEFGVVQPRSATKQDASKRLSLPAGFGSSSGYSGEGETTISLPIIHERTNK